MRNWLRAVVVATDPHCAAELSGIPRPAMKALGRVLAYGCRTAVAARPAAPRRGSPWAGDQHRSPDCSCPDVCSRRPVADRYHGARSRYLRRSRAGSAPTRRCIYGSDPDSWELVTSHAVVAALPAQPPPLVVRRPVALATGLFVAGDHRDTASIQGALVVGPPRRDRGAR